VSQPQGPTEIDLSDVRRFDELAVAARHDVTARARLVEVLQPWVRRWARRYQGRGVDTDDLLQDAMVGVLRAVAGFDPGRGPFLLWARLWVRQALQQTVAESSRAFRLPTHVLWDMHELKQARERLTNRGGREPRLAELADELGWGVDRVADVVRSERQPDDIEGVDLVSHGVGEDAFDEVLEAVTAEQLRPLLLRLSQRERDILQARAEGDSLRTIGRRLGVSGERVRSIEERALARIRAAANLGVDTGPRLLTHRREPTIRKEDRDEHPVPT
jgi:RNA polymerase sigma factor (sigma-70 family)